MFYRGAFCSLNDVARQMLEAQSSITPTPTEQAIIDGWTSAKKAFYKELILDVSDMIATTWHRSFVPFVYEYSVHPSNYAWDDWRLERGALNFYTQNLAYADILSISAIELDSVTVSASDYRLEGTPPYEAITFRNTVSVPNSSDFDSEMTIAGTWGYHESPSTMWKSIGTLPVGGLTDSATTLTDATLDDLAEIYGYWQLESEVIFITDVNTTTHVITFERGALGTTAAAHLAGVTVKKFMPMPQVVMAVRRMVVLLDNKKAEIGDITVIGDTTLQVAGENIKLALPVRYIPVKSI